MSLSPATLTAGAEILAAGRVDPVQPIGHLPQDCSPKDLADAMRLQAELNRILTQRGFGPVVGTKIGCTTRVMQDYLGMQHPCSGAIFATTVHHREATLNYADYQHVGVECEIAVMLGDTIRADAAPHSIDSVSRCVASVHAAIEIVDDRYVDFQNRHPDWKIWVADNFFGAGAVLGTPVEQWQALDLAAIQGKMWIDDQLVGVGFGRDIINGHPLEALRWLADQQAKLDQDLPAGWLILLGSVVQTKWVRPGSVVEVELEELGQARIRWNAD